MKLSPIPAAKLVSLLLLLGFRETRQKGSHLIMQNSEGKAIVVPMHTKEIGIGLLRAIIRETGLSREEYFNALGKA